jgi:hypothetical protein
VGTIVIPVLDAVFVIGGFLFARWLQRASSDYPATVFGPVRSRRVHSS